MPSLETANVGKAVAARVGSNIREVRTKLGMTQAQLAAPEFSISYISAIERGKIRPSLKALSILARRLDVPLTFLLEGSPAGAAEARAVGYSPADSGPDLRIDVDLLQANVLVQQGAFKQAEQLLAPIQPERITTDQVYRLYLLCGQVHLGAGEHQEAVVDLRQAVSQGEALNDSEYAERARNLLGKAYFLLYNYTLAVEHHQHCNSAIDSGQITDPVFSLDVFSNLANDYFRLGDLEKSISFYHRALETLDAMNRDSKSFAAKYMDISQHYKSVGKLAMAREYAMRSQAIYEMREEQRLVGLTHQRLGKALEKQNNLDGAEEEYRKAIAIERELNDEISASICHTGLAELLLKRGQTQDAEHEAQEALRFAESSQDPQTQGQALIALAQIRHQTGDFSAADQYFTRALELLDASQAHEIAASAYFRFANLLEERGEVQRSLSAIKKAYEHQRLGKRGDLE
ncbi:helix-turn-helix domain-containing protein [Ktedonosporobacter rubrisoli]|uniref:Helix-turn-helix domain-containing protein n=1 Tax=Ktedonosporobacter rubrisoli TaxID=2509675 RepID=A0A4V0YZG4_KTERU|nr:tetratricopeptide repeat protein [Ktedonosporobacter rubrisoli]QBD79631.1 helix-turn-helix domain-containing protein [Ktedonosporobacter rubrisoli]